MKSATQECYDCQAAVDKAFRDVSVSTLPHDHLRVLEELKTLHGNPTNQRQWAAIFKAIKLCEADKKWADLVATRAALRTDPNANEQQLELVRELQTQQRSARLELFQRIQHLREGIRRHSLAIKRKLEQDGADRASSSQGASASSDQASPLNFRMCPKFLMDLWAGVTWRVAKSSARNRMRATKYTQALRACFPDLPSTAALPWAQNYRLPLQFTSDPPAQKKVIKDSRRRQAIKKAKWEEKKAAWALENEAKQAKSGKLQAEQPPPWRELDDHGEGNRNNQKSGSSWDRQGPDRSWSSSRASTILLVLMFQPVSF